MDIPIISIYDMLMKRHRQQKKDDQQLLKDHVNSLGQSSKDQLKSEYEKELDSKKSKYRKSRTRIVAGEATKDNMGMKMSSNVVTATHLTKKQSTIALPQSTKKEVINQLVEKSNKKMKLKNTSVPIVESNPGIDASSIKSRIATRGKPKLKKTSWGSGTSNSPNHLALSPRNINRPSMPLMKREKPIKAKAPPIELRTQQTQKTEPKSSVGIRPKSGRLSRRSKILINSKLERKASNNAVCYRL